MKHANEQHMQMVLAKNTGRKTDLVGAICDYIRENSTSRITLKTLASEFGMSPFHIQKVFKEVMGVSPRRYLEEFRLSDMRRHLAKGEPVLKALRGAGYSAQSWLYEDSKKRLGMTPATYRKGGEGTKIAFATGPSSLGRLLVASTEHGVCAVKAGRNDGELMRSLRAEFPRAALARSAAARRHLDALNSHLNGQEVKFPLDIRGTDFQMRVWTALTNIPLGETRSYHEVAEMVGRPRAVRAVANACASNPVPLIIPCHRVIRKDGSLGGYGLGIHRKRDLLSGEKAMAAGAGNVHR